ncbi:hypothetical protein BASA81_004462 [Batrachochytrium salamandrivorans]|nr:hypothetical protein BASA81_004462 [Batrachochytrium salamandrivorans]
MDRWHRLEDAILEIEQFARNEERQRIDHHVLNLEAKLVLWGKRNEDLLRKLEVEREVASRLEQDFALLRAENNRLRSSLIGLQREEILQSCREGELHVLEGVFNLNEVDQGEEEGQEVKNEALRIAASEGFLDVCELLLAQGADPVGRESANGQNALHRAVSALGHSDSVLHLLIQSADVAYNVRGRINDVDLHGQSPLSLAVRLLRVDRVLCLLSFGAETGIVSKEDWQRLNDFQAHQEPDALNESPVLANLPPATAAPAKDRLLFQQGRFDEALQAYAGTGNWTQCARCCASLGRHCEAVEFANRALELAPGSTAALLQRAESKLQVYDFEGAAGDFTELGMEDKASQARHGLREKSEDLYSVLGIPSTATNLDVRKGFLKQCLRWHPDKNRQTRDDEARAGFMFKQVNDAHSVLMDAAKRRDYDAMCLETQGFEEGSSFEEEEEEEEEYDENRQSFFDFLQSKTKSFSPSEE